MIKEAIIKLSKKENLTYTEAEEVMNEIMEGKASDFKAERCKDRQCPVSESDISNPGGKISFACSKGRDTSGRTGCDSAKRR